MIINRYILRIDKLSFFVINEKYYAIIIKMK